MDYFGGLYGLFWTAREHRIKWGNKNLMDLDSDDLSILDESFSKMNLIMVLQVQGDWIGLKINVKSTKLLRLGISEDEKVMLG